MQNEGMLKLDFPIFEKNQQLVYLDSAASNLRPKLVVDRMHYYSSFQHANIHRGAYTLSYEATKIYDDVREKVARFIHANESQSIIFTQGTTDGINMLMESFRRSEWLKPKDKIVISIYEHHSNIVPWQQLAKEKEAKLDYMYDFSESSLSKIDESTKIVAITLMSNATGLITPIEKIIKKAHEVGAVVIGDAAQYIGHKPLDVVNLDIDFVAFSGHKMFGPTGIGVLYGKKPLLEKLSPARFGGDMIEYVTEQNTTYAPLPNRLEAGTPNIDGVVGLGAAIDYIEAVGFSNMQKHTEKIYHYAMNALEQIPFIKILYVDGPSGPIISFNVEEVHPHDVASILDVDQIAIRAGHHCAQPLMGYLNYNATCRISFQVYTREEDIDFFISKLKLTRRWLGYES